MITKTVASQTSSSRTRLAFSRSASLTAAQIPNGRSTHQGSVIATACPNGSVIARQCHPVLPKYQRS